jgi:hypothetical protein
VRIILFLLIAAHCKSTHAQLKPEQSLGSFRAVDIKNAWQADSCGFALRDSIANILIERRNLYNLSESDIYFLFGRPTDSTVSENGKIIYYVLLGTFNVALNRCDDNVAARIFRIRFDPINHRVNYYDAMEE